MLVGITFALLSCSSAKVVSIDKIEVNPGVLNTELYYRFISKIDTKKETIFKSVSIDSITILKFSVIDELTQLQSDSKKSYPKGKYLLQFDLPKGKILKNKKDILKFTLEQNGKNYFLTSKVDSIKIVKLR
ncbi:hypothetical protein IU405_11295 [Polaribacter sp. BAL334]|uniref:hypothetical protein n=1 Tax=Polaribacter sp. BAL334 TaxID=1708178 RepID=UPI0018D2298E|nr:hypothetical protein [Polaribacter sp. BAL334]MBG7612831.1 hypothetical protein [Polaribacter sp. BAL334]